MKYEPIDGGLKQLKENLSKMTFKEKIDHLWTYYKSALLVLAIVIAVCSIIVTCIQNKNTETLLSGVGINVILSDEGRDYVENVYFEQHKTGGREQVLYSESSQEDYATTSSMEESYMALMSLMALTAAGDLDYMLLDDLAIRNLLVHQMFQDLREIYTEAELEAMGDRVVWGEVGTETDSRYIPFAINIEYIPFIAENARNVADTYFAFVVNSPRAQETKEYLDFLMAWEPAA